VLVWTGDASNVSPTSSPPARHADRAPLTYTPPPPDRKDPRCPPRPGRGAQAGYRAVCRSQRFDGSHPRP
jgi:hypothetical protein